MVWPVATGDVKDLTDYVLLSTSINTEALAIR